MKLIENIIRFEEHFKNALKLKENDVSDYFIYNTLAMECFQAANALMEIGESIITFKKLGYPSTYREIFEILFKKKLINKIELDSSRKLVFLRNLIAHEYYKIDENELLDMIEQLKILDKFVNRINNEFKSEK